MPELGDVKKKYYLCHRQSGKKKGQELLIPTKIVWVECPSCKQRRWQRYSNQSRSEKMGLPSGLCRSCFYISMRGRAIKHPAWKGGRWNRDGYAHVKIEPDDPMIEMASRMSRGYTYYIPEHRLVMARKLGRPLLSSEHVHHLNGIRDDNRHDNLQVLDNKSHPKMSFVHALQNRIRELERIKETVELT